MSPGKSLLRRHRDEAGYAALLVALLASTVFLGMAALGVDTARWYVEAERIQKAADAAALAGATYMPARLDRARVAAIATATKNGYPNSGSSTVTVQQGNRPSELRVTVTSRVKNAFGGALGVTSSVISRTAVADYTAPAPMGSPCNTFGNEPPSTAGAAQPVESALPSPPSPNCKSNPQFWAAVEGPGTDKLQGDRYGTYKCASTTTLRCTTSKLNDEYRPEGYFWTIHVEPDAINTKIDLQLYDPAYVSTNVDCQDIPNGTSLWDRMSSYTPADGKARYKNTSSVYCSGDYLASASPPPNTTFLIREPTATGDPLQSPVVSGCTKQFAGTTSTPSLSSLKEWTTETGSTANTSFNRERARTFHQWVSLCDNGGFTATKTGDYYLQVRTNAKLEGTPVANSGSNTPVVYVNSPDAAEVDTGDDVTTTVGVNSFAIRAVPTDVNMRSRIAVAGYYRMPILQNVAGSVASFPLIRALPSTKGQYIAFDFYDVSDCASSCSAKVKVVKPVEASGSFVSGPLFQPCQGALNDNAFTVLTNCLVNVANSTHNGQLQHMIVPIPTDYTCDPTTLGGCWFSVELDFNGADVTDITTWDANIGGDPVRLIE